uniref:Uncharacterized protein n=1 Tax=Clastoptera arizonana TaxID=38151 RepID=A0A1B6DY81_9HEMI
MKLIILLSCCLLTKAGELNVDLSLLLRALDGQVSKQLKLQGVLNENKLFQGILLYNRTLNYIIQLAKKQDERAIVPGKALYKKGGPQFLNIKHDQMNIKFRFDWSLTEYHNLLEKLDETKVLWEEFIKTYLRNTPWFLYGQTKEESENKEKKTQ